MIRLDFGFDHVEIFIKDHLKKDSQILVLLFQMCFWEYQQILYMLLNCYIYFYTFGIYTNYHFLEGRIDDELTNIRQGVKQDT